jgi:hypothetical protein
MYEYDCRQKNLLKVFESDRLSNSIAAPIQATAPATPQRGNVGGS